MKNYLELLDLKNATFLLKYLEVPSLKRLKNVGYFCGMDYTSKDIYSFTEYISRFDHSLTVALLTYKLTKDKIASIAGLFHDIATPCFSHAIDYMFKDYTKQESTEKKTEEIILNDKELLRCLKEDGITPSTIINYKSFTVVDNDRPKLCADRLDCVILTGIGLLKMVSRGFIESVLNDITLYINEDGEQEIGFCDMEIAKKVVEINDLMDDLFHKKEDFYVMDLLSKIASYSIDKSYISYDMLYSLGELDILNILDKTDDIYLKEMLNEFRTKKKKDIPELILPKIKRRDLNPLVNNKRLSNL